MNDTVILLVLVGLVTIFKWLTKSGGESAEQPPPPPPPNESGSDTPPLSEQERVRRFLEALGVPPGTQPPPPVRSRKITPRPAVADAPAPKVRRSWVQPLPPLVTRPADMSSLPPLTDEPARQPFLVREMEPAPVLTPQPPVSPLEASPKSPALLRKKAAPAQITPLRSVRPLLLSREKIRQAIILREILGPPRALEPFGSLLGQ